MMRGPWRHICIRWVGTGLLLASATACGHATLSESDATNAVLAALNEIRGETIDIRKTDGQQRDVSGAKAYAIFVRAAVKLPIGWASVTNVIGRPDVQQENDLVVRTPRGWTPDIPSGAIYAIDAEVVFELMEKGWRQTAVKRKRSGLCRISSTARQCYLELKWQS